MRSPLSSAFFSALRVTARLGRSLGASGEGSDEKAAIEGRNAMASGAGVGMMRRVLRGARSVVGGALQEALSSEEKSRLGVALYEVSDAYRDAPRYEWEDAWLARWIDARDDRSGNEGSRRTRDDRSGNDGSRRARDDRSGNEGSPSAGGRARRVLVGAAGAGREVMALLDRGCEVIAIEPSPSLAALCRTRTNGRVEVIEARYEELSGRALPRVDAALLGLGSLSHVLDATARARLLEALGAACPRGPILASTLAAPRGMSIVEARREGRGARVGRAIGGVARAARGLAEVDEGEIVFDALGFAKLFTREELGALGEGRGRRTIFEEGAPDGMILCAFVL